MGLREKRVSNHLFFFSKTGDTLH